MSNAPGDELNLIGADETSSTGAVADEEPAGGKQRGPAEEYPSPDTKRQKVAVAPSQASAEASPPLQLPDRVLPYASQKYVQFASSSQQAQQQPEDQNMVSPSPHQRSLRLPPVDPTTASTEDLHRQIIAVNRRIRRLVQVEVDHLNKAKTAGDQRAQWKQILDRLMQELKDRGEDKAGLGDIPVPPDFPSL